MDDAELDRALNEALSVSPSPEFVAKVRRSIAADSVPSTLATRWLVPAGAAVVLLMILVIVLPVLKSRTQMAVDAEPVDLTRRGADIVLESPRPLESHSSTPSPVPPGRTSGAALARRSDFQVIFSPIDAAAYRRIFASVASAPYEISSAPAFVPAESSMTSVDIAPIVIEPLDAFSSETGVLQ